MVNEVALIMLLGMFGWKIAAIYAGFGLLIAILGGLMLGKMGAEKWIIKSEIKDGLTGDGIMNFSQRLDYAKRYTIYIKKSLAVRGDRYSHRCCDSWLCAGRFL